MKCFRYAAMVQTEDTTREPRTITFEVTLPGDDFSREDRAAYLRNEALATLKRLISALLGEDQEYEVVAVTTPAGAPDLPCFKGVTESVFASGIGGLWHRTKG